jgi:hypothetical protein
MGPGQAQGSYQSSTYGQPPPADQPWQREPDQPWQRESAPAPGAGGWSYEESPQPQPSRKSRRGLIIALVAAAVVVVVGVGGYVGWSLTNRTSQFTVGSCVRQDGGSAVSIDCGTSGAYEITSIVETDGGCSDVNQPSLVLTEIGGGKKYACLVPASG